MSWEVTYSNLHQKAVSMPLGPENLVRTIYRTIYHNGTGSQTSSLKKVFLNELNDICLDQLTHFSVHITADSLLVNQPTL